MSPFTLVNSEHTVVYEYQVSDCPLIFVARFVSLICVVTCKVNAKIPPPPRYNIYS